MCCQFNVYFTYSSICQCYVVTTLLFGWVKAWLGLGKDHFISFTNTEQNRGHWHGSLLLSCHAATSRHNVPTSKYPHTHVIWTLYDTYCRNTDMLDVIWCLQIWTYGKHDIQTFYSGEYDQALKLISFPSWCFFLISFFNLISIFNINLQRVAVITIIILLPDVVLPVTSALNLPVSLKWSLINKVYLSPVTQPAK